MPPALPAPQIRFAAAANPWLAIIAIVLVAVSLRPGIIAVGGIVNLIDRRINPSNFLSESSCDAIEKAPNEALHVT